jgi:hypothetical protein
MIVKGCTISEAQIRHLQRKSETVRKASKEDEED